MDDLGEDDRQVLDALEPRMSRPAVDVAGKARLSTAATEASLGRLLLTSLAERTAQGWRLSADAVGRLRAT